jgi:hypothetical protein
VGQNAGLGRLDKNKDLEAARNGKPLRFVFLKTLRPSADLGLGHPGVTQAWICGSVFVCNENKE